PKRPANTIMRLDAEALFHNGIHVDKPHFPVEYKDVIFASIEKGLVAGIASEEFFVSASTFRDIPGDHQHCGVSQRRYGCIVPALDTSRTWQIVLNVQRFAVFQSPLKQADEVLGFLVAENLKNRHAG